MEKFYKNFILCGEVDYYCILCQEGFVDDKTVEKHLRWEKHRNNIKKQEYVHKFKKDCIYKITDANFYCEVCNLVIQNASDHVKESNHQARKSSDKNNKKSSSYVQCEENGSIKIKNQNVTKLQWHGIVDNMCLLCNEPVVRIVTHINSLNHMIKLMQTETISENNQHYRKFGINNIYCFTCFKVFESKFLDTHWADNHKENNKSAAQELCKENIEKSSKINHDPNNNKDSITIKVLKKVEKKYFSFDVENKATCLECKETVELNFDAIDKHKKIHIPAETIGTDLFINFFEDKGKRRAELAKYGRDNYIRLNEGGSKGYCSLCNIYLSAHINTAKQHVEGAFHRGHLELKGFIKDQKHEKPTTKSVPYKTFLEVMFGPFEIDDVNVVCLNDGICVDTLSFMLVSVIDDFKSRKGKCYGCDVTMNWFDLKKHIKTKEHTKIQLECKVLPIATKGDDEFIRQIHPGLYHCGYCNRVYPFWENVKKHLKSFPHDVKRQKAKLMSCISAKMYLDPSCDLSDIKEYTQLRKLYCFE